MLQLNAILRLLLPGLLILWVAASTGQTLAVEPLRFNRDIRPILSDNCFACHGPDQANRKADMRLDQAGDWDNEEFLRRILSDDNDEIMPPPKSQKTLSASQKELLKRWIADGAKYESHWSFALPIKPTSRNSIDDFIREELPKHGLKPSNRADATTLTRRLALDLTGLPPTLDEQQRFASSDSYEAMVDYFLSKPAYGEHMAVAWLDAARYADTNGYQVDRDRELWPWRDWVVRAFNANMPFDQFTIEQLAGDLLPDPTVDQRIATGFHRNHMMNEEGGIIDAEFLAEYTADRVETTAAVWLGQTFNCCRCHDHKFDPFTQRDFYAMKAYFHNVPERGVGIYSNPIRTNSPPFIKLPSPELESKVAAANAKLKVVEDEMAAFDVGDIDLWTKELAESEIDWEPLEPTSATGGDEPPIVADNAVSVGPQESRANNIKITAKLPAGKLTALRIECVTEDSSATFLWSELKVAKVKLRPLETEDGKLIDGDRRSRINVSVTPDKPKQAFFVFESAVKESELTLTLGVENANGTTQWQMFATTVSAKLIASEAIIAIAKKESSKRTARDQKQLIDYRKAQLADYRRLTDEATALRKEVADVEAEIPTTLVMDEQKEPRPTFILMRGAYDKPSDPVSMATPTVLPQPAADLPKNRLGLARWLVSPENPLTARVTVNRFWQQFFGAGLVRSSEDFGSQGDLPSHPELLDWLAVDFQESSWDVKRLVKMFVMSETYQQSSSHPADGNQNPDPSNTFLARGPRHRLSAEVIRDQALAASGLLVSKLGGPAVKPYHPPGLYEQVVAQRDNPKASYIQGQGEDLHRRSLYTYWKRSVPHPSMMIFDVPFREVCSMRRSRSNTPLQALNLMNDPTYVEASRFLAQRMIQEGGEATETRIAHGFQLLLAREPSSQELKILVTAVERAHADFEKDDKAAAEFLSVGESKTSESIASTELAAFTSLASTLLNLDETITKE
jgi:Protein of unknown function (DUF1553)/Protein of unknown function (DUF1549)/Planctomycete cytochrome C